MLRFVQIFLFFPVVFSAHASVTLFDNVTSMGTPVYLKVLTKKRFFPQGGHLVEIYLENKKLGRILSGGDGYGFLKYIPESAGLKPVEARTESSTDTGVILVMDKTEKAILVEVEISLAKTIFSKKLRTDTRNVLKTLANKFRLIYITRFIGPVFTKKILSRETYPKSVVLKWQGQEMFEDLKKRRVCLHAIVGSSALISEASGYVDKRFTFEETEEGMYVEDWQEIIKQLE